MESVELFKVLPGAIVMGPGTTVPIVFAGEIPAGWTHYPILVTLRIVDREDFAILFSFCFSPVQRPAAVFVGLNLETTVDEDVGNLNTAVKTAPTGNAVVDAE